MRVGVALLALVLAVSPAGARAGDEGGASPLVREQDGVKIDWSACELRATAGAAADPRMPSVAAARPGAQRRARAAAGTKLRAALGALPLGAGRKLSEEEIDRAMAHSSVAGVELQSNGGAVLTLTVRFRDWLVSPPQTAEPAAVLAVPRMPLEAAPTVEVKGRQLSVGSACYRLGAPPAAARAVTARRNAAGRLVVDGGATLADTLAGAPVLIYVEKLAR